MVERIQIVKYTDNKFQYQHDAFSQVTDTRTVDGKVSVDVSDVYTSQKLLNITINNIPESFIAEEGDWTAIVENYYSTGNDIHEIDILPKDLTMSLPVCMGTADFRFKDGDDTYYLLTTYKSTRPLQGLPLNEFVFIKGDWQNKKTIFPRLSYNGIFISSNSDSGDGTRDVYTLPFAYGLSPTEKASCYHLGTTTEVKDLLSRDLKDKSITALYKKRIGQFVYIESIDRKFSFTIKKHSVNFLSQGVISILKADTILGEELKTFLYQRFLEISSRSFITTIDYPGEFNEVSFLNQAIEFHSIVKKMIEDHYKLLAL